MTKSKLIEHFKGQKLSKDVWVLPSDEDIKESSQLKALEFKNKLLLITFGAIIAVFGFFVLTYGVYW